MLGRLSNTVQRMLTPTSQYDKEIIIDKDGIIDQNNIDQDLKNNIKILFEKFPDNSDAFKITYIREGYQKSHAYIDKIDGKIDQSLTGAALDNEGGIPISLRSKDLSTKLFIGLAAALILDNRFRDYAIERYTDKLDTSYAEVLGKVDEILTSRSEQQENNKGKFQKYLENQNENKETGISK